MNNVLSPVKYGAACLLLLCSCAEPLPDGAYRVRVEATSSQPMSIVRKYTIETTSLRTLALEEPGGATSHSIAPDIMTRERSGKAEATVTVVLNEAGDNAHVTVNMVVSTRGGMARNEEVLPVPGVADLASVLSETRPEGHLTSATSLLRVSAGKKYLKILIK